MHMKTSTALGTAHITNNYNQPPARVILPAWAVNSRTSKYMSIHMGGGYFPQTGISKSNQFVPVPYATDSENFTEIRPQLSELSD